MFSTPFIIDGRILVDPELGQVTNMRLQTNTRIERRLMKLLCLLVRNQGKTVSSKKIKKEIKDYCETAGEGLRDAIADLRKKLEDSQGSLIRTIDEDGYMIKAVITDATDIVPQGPGRRKAFHTIQKYSWLVIIASLLAIILFLFFNQGKSPNPDASPEPGVTLPASHDTSTAADTTGKINR